MKVLISVLVSFGFFTSIGMAQSAQPGHKGQHSMHEGHGNVTDAHFLDRFIKHHQDGIEMAKLAQSKAQSSEIKSMANKILKDRPKEISQMQTWRERHFASVEKATDMPPKMDMSKLQNSKGTEFDIAFADMMAKHHEDGIKMIEEVKGDLKNPEVKKFVERSQRNQSKERDQLAQLKNSLEGSASGATSAQ